MSCGVARGVDRDREHREDCGHSRSWQRTSVLRFSRRCLASCCAGHEGQLRAGCGLSPRRAPMAAMRRYPPAPPRRRQALSGGSPDTSAAAGVPKADAHAHCSEFDRVRSATQDGAVVWRASSKACFLYATISRERRAAECPPSHSILILQRSQQIRQGCVHQSSALRQ